MVESSTVMPQNTDALIATLRGIVGAEHVLTDQDDRSFYSMDVYRQLEIALCVVRPGSVEELSKVVAATTATGTAVVPRGGGASYTDGYLPSTPNSVLIDASRLNRIVEINQEDMYVTVEAGVTWAALNEALQARDLRTPFWGPFSGLQATIGGSISQNSVSMGSGAYGVSADSVLSMQVVLANGDILRTGAHAAANSTPFNRYYGPDTTGLFTGDGGALGIKGTITLKLIERPPAFGAISFGFDSFEQMSKGMAAISRSGIASDNFGLDPRLQSGQLGRTTTKDAIRSALGVFKSSRNPIEGAWKVAKLGIAGKRFFKGYGYSAHYTVEAIDRRSVASQLAGIRRVAKPFGNEIANTVPTVLRAMPFIPLYPILGPKGERWVPQHGILPFSRVQDFRDQLMALYARHADDMKRLTITNGAMFETVGNHAFLYEPVFYWEDSRTQFHNRYLPKEHVDTLPNYEENPEGRELVHKMRSEILDVFASVGATHYQVGKTYRYLEGRQPESTRLLRDLKASLDPNGLVNPGTLGL